jgi:hypothetical protein
MKNMISMSEVGVIRNWQDVTDLDYPPHSEIIEEDQKAAFKQTRRWSRGCGVRFMLGRISTSRELEERRQKAMKKPLV